MQDRDGTWWLAESEQNKLRLAESLIAGIQLGRTIATREMLNSVKGDDVAINKLIDAGRKDETDYQNLTPTRLVEWLNNLYRDSRNLNIRVHDALWVKLNEITGRSEEEINNLIERYR
jgi:hypothetical protein